MPQPLCTCWDHPLPPFVLNTYPPPPSLLSYLPPTPGPRTQAQHHSQPHTTQPPTPSYKRPCPALPLTHTTTNAKTAPAPPPPPLPPSPSPGSPGAPKSAATTTPPPAASARAPNSDIPGRDQPNLHNSLAVSRHGLARRTLAQVRTPDHPRQRWRCDPLQGGSFVVGNWSRSNLRAFQSVAPQGDGNVTAVKRAVFAK
ncbi:hypothetical protein KC19_6G007400 [Ceratodon purpureus]|uniref:Uncharacterized protein n=1 Tax=Ceratodon purpureus TaxID=3225 RepID=A0A8T0HD78_CERPU|nr:hypothetical protein KC19_6G007400 [Ceratodon purpureus]